MKSKKFNLFGSTWTIEYPDKLENPTGEGSFWLGSSDGMHNEIKVALKDNEGKNFSKEELKITELHEITHAIFKTGQYNDLCDNEALVEWIARCLNALIKQKILK